MNRRTGRGRRVVNRRVTEATTQDADDTTGSMSREGVEYENVEDMMGGL